MIRAHPALSAQPIRPTPMQHIQPTRIPASRPTRSTSAARRLGPTGRAAGGRLSAGFTLIEIMVVVVIIGLLAAMIVPEVMHRVEDARVSKARGDIQALTTALTMFRLDNFKYPTTDQGLQALVQRPEDASIKNWRPYLSQGSLKDPWGNEYQYVYPGTHGREYDLFSLGPNGQEGGADTSSVIGNWNLDESGGGNGGSPTTAGTQ